MGNGDRLGARDGWQMGFVTILFAGAGDSGSSCADSHIGARSGTTCAIGSKACGQRRTTCMYASDIELKTRLTPQTPDLANRGAAWVNVTFA